jgi:Glycosyl hydrolase family 12
MKIHYPIVLFLLLSSFLSGCGSNLISTPAETPIPTSTPTLITTFTPTQTNTPTPTATPTIVASQIVSSCEDEALIDIGEYQAQIDAWGKGTLTGWSECIGAGIDTDGTLIGHWTWDWLNSGGNVKAFPAIVFGQVPSRASTTASLPIQISQIDAATISYGVSSKHTGSGNLAFHMWLTNTQNPSTWGVPPITHEVMIWLEAYGGMTPAGAWIKQVGVDNSQYDLFVADNFGMGWKFIVFSKIPDQRGSGTLNLVSFLSYIQKEGLITGNEYLASISLGNEVISGIGETNLKGYGITVQKK